MIADEAREVSAARNDFQSLLADVIEHRARELPADSSPAHRGRHFRIRDGYDAGAHAVIGGRSRAFDVEFVAVRGLVVAEFTHDPNVGIIPRDARAGRYGSNARGYASRS